MQRDEYIHSKTIKDIKPAEEEVRQNVKKTTLVYRQKLLKNELKATATKLSYQKKVYERNLNKLFTQKPKTKIQNLFTAHSTMAIPKLTNRPRRKRFMELEATSTNRQNGFRI